MLGKKVKDSITGFKGTATSKHIYLNGNTQYGVERDGDVETKFIDEERLEVVSEESKE